MNVCVEREEESEQVDAIKRKQTVLFTWKRAFYLYFYPVQIVSLPSHTEEGHGHKYHVRTNAF